MPFLDAIFKPDSIAVIGSSDDQGKLGYVITKAFLDMGICTKIYPVNRSTRSVHDLRAYKDVSEIQEDIDLAVIIVPPSSVPEALRSCTEKGVKGVILFSSVISEDEALSEKLVDLAAQRGTRLIGPDSMGIYCPSGGLALFPEMPRQIGPVGFVSHSGAIAYMVSHYGVRRGIAFSKVIDCGNECDLTYAEILEYLGQDPDTQLIGGYLEGTKDGRRLFQVASNVARNKPVILLKGGKTPQGSRMVASHTGMLAGSSGTWESLFRQTGVIEVESLDDLIDCLVMFAKSKPVKGDRVALISGTGGPLVLATDLCHEAGLQVPTLSPELREKIRRFLPPQGTSEFNPIDLSIAAGVNVSLYGQACQIVGNSDEIDATIVIHAGEWRGTEVAEQVMEIAHSSNKPLAMVLLGSPEGTSHTLKTLVQAGVPAFSSLERTVKQLASLIRYNRFTG